MKVRFWYYIQNYGDGSCFPKFFKTKEAAEEFAGYDNERYCDDIQFKELEFNLDGSLVVEDPNGTELERLRYAEKTARLAELYQKHSI